MTEQEEMKALLKSPEAVAHARRMNAEAALAMKAQDERTELLKGFCDVPGRNDMTEDEVKARIEGQLLREITRVMFEGDGKA